MTITAANLVIYDDYLFNTDTQPTLVQVTGMLSIMYAKALALNSTYNSAYVDAVINERVSAYIKQNYDNKDAVKPIQTMNQYDIRLEFTEAEIKIIKDNNSVEQLPFINPDYLMTDHSNYNTTFNYRRF